MTLKIGERRPGMANLTLAVMRRVMQLAVKRKLRGDNPFAAALCRPRAPQGQPATIAEHGGTGKELASVAGHKTLKETERYTKAADQIKLAREAIGKLKVPNSKGKNA
jgi:hypothetical protein